MSQTADTPLRSKLSSLLAPKSVAIIGATDDPRSFGGAPIYNLRQFGYDGLIYPISRRLETAQGLACHSSILDVDGDIESAVIAIAADHVAGAVKECAEKGVQSVIITSAGFAEGAGGAQGQARAAALQSVIDDTGIRVLGPNTTGVVNLLDRYVPRTAHNQHDAQDVRAGSVALVAQSGALSNAILSRAQASKLPVGVSVATGNQCDVDVWDVAGYLLEDHRIRTIMLVVEACGAIDKLEALALGAADRQVSLLILKSGESAVGQRSAMTHTGSLAGDAAVQRAAFRRLGIVQVEDFDQLWEVATLLTAWGKPAADDSPTLGVFCVSGGEGVLLADESARLGVSLGEISDGFADYIQTHFGFAEAANPFDPTGEAVSRPHLMKESITSFATLNDFGATLVAFPIYREELAEYLFSEFDESTFAKDARVALTYWPATKLTERFDEILRATQVPVFTDSFRALRAYDLYKRCAYSGLDRAAIQTDETSDVASESTADQSYLSVRDYLSGELSLEFARAIHVEDEEAAVASAIELGFPVVVKGNAASTIHKQANGLVATGLVGSDSVREAWRRISEAGTGLEIEGMVIEKFAIGDLQIFLGARRDPDFGVVVAAGTGGSIAEYARDTAVLPLRYLSGDESVREMLSQTAAGRCLAERSSAATTAIVKTLRSLGGWMLSHPEIESVDLNPVLAGFSDGKLVCVDARIATSDGALS